MAACRVVPVAPKLVPVAPEIVPVLLPGAYWRYRYRHYRGTTTAVIMLFIVCPSYDAGRGVVYT